MRRQKTITVGVRQISVQTLPHVTHYTAWPIYPIFVFLSATMILWTRIERILGSCHLATKYFCSVGLWGSSYFCPHILFVLFDFVIKLLFVEQLKLSPFKVNKNNFEFYLVFTNNMLRCQFTHTHTHTHTHYSYFICLDLVSWLLVWKRWPPLCIQLHSFSHYLLTLI